jgi:hypothetical protein
VNSVVEQGSISGKPVRTKKEAPTQINISKLNLELNYSHGDEYDLDQ